MYKDTSEHAGILCFLIGSLVWIGDTFYRPPPPWYDAFLVFSFSLLFVGLILILDWIAALAIYRIYTLRKALELPWVTILDRIERLDPAQLRTLTNLDLLVEEFEDKEDEAE